MWSAWVRSNIFITLLKVIYNLTFCPLDQLSSVQSLSHVYLRPRGLQHARLPCASPTLGACSSSCPSSQWCHPTISSSVVTFSSWLQSFPASGSFLMSQLFTSSGQSIGASASVLPMNIQDWFSLGWTCLISLQSKGLSRVFSNTTVYFLKIAFTIWNLLCFHTDFKIFFLYLKKFYW